MTQAPDVPEIALSAAWHAQRVAGPLRTGDGRTVEVVHRGTLTHGFGPDFRDALLLFDGQELRADLAVRCVPDHTTPWRSVLAARCKASTALVRGRCASGGLGRRGGRCGSCRNRVADCGRGIQRALGSVRTGKACATSAPIR